MSFQDGIHNATLCYQCTGAEEEVEDVEREAEEETAIHARQQLKNCKRCIPNKHRSQGRVLIQKFRHAPLNIHSFPYVAPGESGIDSFLFLLLLLQADTSFLFVWIPQLLIGK